MIDSTIPMYTDKTNLIAVDFFDEVSYCSK